MTLNRVEANCMQKLKLLNNFNKQTKHKILLMLRNCNRFEFIHDGYDVQVT